MDFDQIKQFIQTLEESKLNKLVVKRGDFELHLEKAAPMVTQRMVVPETANEPNFQAEIPHKPERAAPVRMDKPGSFVTSPMVGTFYASPSPDQPNFVKVGDRVEAGTVVCIVEAMKVMNEVKAGVGGTIAEVLADNGQPVEFGLRLFRIT